MTREQRLLFTVDEVLAIELECPSCHVRTVIRIMNEAPLPARCRHCSDGWLIGEKLREHADAVDALELLRKSMQILIRHASQSGYAIRLEMLSEENKT